MTVRPLHDRILVQRIDEGEQKVGGIIIPREAAAGRGHRRRQWEGDRRRQADPPRRQSRDRILFGKYAGQEIKLDGEEYFIMKEDDVLAVIEGHTQKKLAAIKGKTNKKKT